LELETTREKLIDANREIIELKETQQGSESIHAEVDQDVKDILVILDELLANLPDDLIEKFANSDDFTLYEKVLEGYGI